MREILDKMKFTYFFTPNFFLRSILSNSNSKKSLRQEGV